MVWFAIWYCGLLCFLYFCWFDFALVLACMRFGLCLFVDFDLILLWLLLILCFIVICGCIDFVVWICFVCYDGFVDLVLFWLLYLLLRWRDLFIGLLLSCCYCVWFGVLCVWVWILVLLLVGGYLFWFCGCETFVLLCLTFGVVGMVCLWVFCGFLLVLIDCVYSWLWIWGFVCAFANWLDCCSC